MTRRLVEEADGVRIYEVLDADGQVIGLDEELLEDQPSPQPIEERLEALEQRVTDLEGGA